MLQKHSHSYSFELEFLQEGLRPHPKIDFFSILRVFRLGFFKC